MDELKPDKVIVMNDEEYTEYLLELSRKYYEFTDFFKRHVDNMNKDKEKL